MGSTGALRTGRRTEMIEWANGLPRGRAGSQESGQVAGSRARQTHVDTASPNPLREAAAGTRKWGARQSARGSRPLRAGYFRTDYVRTICNRIMLF